MNKAETSPVDEKREGSESFQSSSRDRSSPKNAGKVVEAHNQYGRLILDPVEAEKELGKEVSSNLKLTPNGKWILWPQPYVSYRLILA
jgi:hypothetical protein